MTSSDAPSRVPRGASRGGASDGGQLNVDQRRARNVQTMRTWFALQEAMDVETWLDLWADDCGQTLPFAPAALPRRLNGKDTMAQLYRTLFQGFADLHIRDLRIDPLHDPDVVLVRWHTHASLSNGEIYDNDLIGVFEFDPDGRVRHLTEYLDPTRVNIAG